MLIKSHVWWLIAAALVFLFKSIFEIFYYNLFKGALFVAFLNIRIPILLGQMINIIARFLSKESKPNFSLIKPIGIQLGGLYIGQV